MSETAGIVALTPHGALPLEFADETFPAQDCREPAAARLFDNVIKAFLESDNVSGIHDVFTVYLNGVDGPKRVKDYRSVAREVDQEHAFAGEKGFAEADPSLDINGWDAGHKAIILGWLSYGRWLKPEEVSVNGIETISSEDVTFADSLGYEIKLLAVIRQNQGDERIEVRVAPSLIPRTHILSSVDGVFNAVAVHGNVVGETLFYGSGAGQDATSSAVISDLADVAENLINEVGCTGFVPHGDYGVALPLEETLSQYYLRLSVVDEPGVLARIANITGENGIGILSVIQPEPKEPSEHIPLVLLLHDATYGTVSTALKAVLALESVESEHTLLRVETLER